MPLICPVIKSAINLTINKNITSYANPGWWARNFGGDNAGKELKIGTSTIEKEKLFSRNKYIRRNRKWIG